MVPLKRLGLNIYHFQFFQISDSKSKIIFEYGLELRCLCNVWNFACCFDFRSSKLLLEKALNSAEFWKLKFDGFPQISKFFPLM